MKKFVLGLVVMLFCCSCGKNIAVVSLKDNLVFEYGDKIILDNLVSIKDGYLINGDTEYDYKDVGEQIVTIDYRDTKKHKGKYDVTINIVDSVKPILSISNNLYVLKDNGIDVCKRAFYADNADRNVACQVIGDIDTTKEGKYKVNVKVTDASGNYVDKDVIVNVIEKFEETPEVEIVPDKIEDMILKYKTKNTLIGIDVSNHQGDIDWESGLLTVEKSSSVVKNRTKDSDAKYVRNVGSTKNEKARIIKLSDNALQTLKKISEVSKDIRDDSLIITTKTGRAQTATNLEHRAATVFRNAGLDNYSGGLHIFRRTFATRAYEKGARVADIAAYIGDLESTTMKYYIAKRKKFIDSEGVEKQIVDFPA